jgi:hypothetical protein
LLAGATRIGGVRVLLQRALTSGEKGKKNLLTELTGGV